MICKHTNRKSERCGLPEEAIIHMDGWIGGHIFEPSVPIAKLQPAEPEVELGCPHGCTNLQVAKQCPVHVVEKVVKLVPENIMHKSFDYQAAPATSGKVTKLVADHGPRMDTRRVPPAHYFCAECGKTPEPCCHFSSTTQATAKTYNTICNNCGKPVENTSGVLLHIRDGMEFVNETLPDKRRCFMFAALALPEAQPTPPEDDPLSAAVDPSGAWLEYRHAVLAGVSDECIESQKAAFYAGLAAQPTPGWISVKERLPVVGEWCLVVHSGHVQRMAVRLSGIGFACAEGYEWIWVDEDADSAPVQAMTHWQPLPSPPEPMPTKKENA